MKKIIILTLSFLLIVYFGYITYTLYYVPKHYTKRPWIQATSSNDKYTYCGEYIYPLKNVTDDADYTLVRRMAGIEIYRITDSQLLYKAKNSIVVYHRISDNYNPFNTISLYKDDKLIEYIELNEPDAMFSWSERSTTCIWPLYILSQWKICLLLFTILVLIVIIKRRNLFF